MAFKSELKVQSDKIQLGLGLHPAGTRALDGSLARFSSGSPAGALDVGADGLLGTDPGSIPLISRPIPSCPVTPCSEKVAASVAVRRIPLRNLPARVYEHPFDREALAKLEAAPALPRLTRRLYEATGDRLLLLMSMANRIRVSPRQFRHLHDLFMEAKRILDVDEDVQLYVEQAYLLNAYTMGIEHKQVVVTTELIDRLTDDEIVWILGHELGHVKSEHVLFLTIARFFPSLADAVGRATLGIGQLVGLPLQLLLLDWMRKSELTADRAGLLVCQDVDVSVKALARLAGVPRRYLPEISMEEIRAQTSDYEALTEVDANKFFQFYGQAFSTHPWLAIRMRELDEWSGEPYARVMREFGASGSGVRTGDSGVRTGDSGLRTGDSGLRTADSGVRTGEQRRCSACGAVNGIDDFLCLWCGEPFTSAR